MDKIINYSISDKLIRENNISVSIRITTIGYPVSETLEYYNDGKWSEDISNIGNEYDNLGIQKEWDNFQSRLLSFLDDGNMRVIIDIMGQSDEYYCDKYKLKVVVDSAQIDY